MELLLVLLVGIRESATLGNWPESNLHSKRTKTIHFNYTAYIFVCVFVRFLIALITVVMMLRSVLIESMCTV